MEARSGVERKATRRATTKKPDGDIGLNRVSERIDMKRGTEIGRR
jgi:hypothetical protein